MITGSWCSVCEEEAKSQGGANSKWWWSGALFTYPKDFLVNSDKEKYQYFPKERGLRSGTVPTPLVVGLGAACELANREMEYDHQHVKRLSDMLVQVINSLAMIVILLSSKFRISG